MRTPGEILPGDKLQFIGTIIPGDRITVMFKEPGYLYFMPVKEEIEIKTSKKIENEKI